MTNTSSGDSLKTRSEDLPSLKVASLSRSMT